MSLPANSGQFTHAYRQDTDKRRKAPAKSVTPLFGEGEDKECHIHDLRRTLASVLSDLGFKAYADQVLGHANKSVTDIYTRTSVRPLLAMVEEAGKHIMTHLGFTEPPTPQVALHPQVCCPAVVPETLSYLLSSDPMTFVSAFETLQKPLAPDQAK